jgi:hypothetical protein
MMSNSNRTGVVADNNPLEFLSTKSRSLVCNFSIGPVEVGALHYGICTSYPTAFCMEENG